MEKQLLIVGITVLLIAVVLSGCTEQTNNEDDNTISEYDRFVGTWMYEESGAIYIFSWLASFI